MTRLGQPWAASTRRLREWFEAGNTGTVREICGALTMNRKTAEGSLQRLRALGLVCQVGVREYRNGGPRGPLALAPVYGLRLQPHGLVAVAMQHRTPLEHAWGARS